MARRVLYGFAMKMMTRTFVLLGTLGLLAAPALAEKRVGPATKAAAKNTKPNCGESFDLAPRHAVTPKGDGEPAHKQRTLTDAQIAAVVKAKLPDIEYCWTRLPQHQRAESTAVLELAIDPDGTVDSAEIGGDVPVEAHKCMVAAAVRWTFPTADATTEIEYAVALRTVNYAK
jgi:hypothetical protein